MAESCQTDAAFVITEGNVQHNQNHPHAPTHLVIMLFYALDFYLFFFFSTKVCAVSEDKTC